MSSKSMVIYGITPPALQRFRNTILAYSLFGEDYVENYPVTLSIACNDRKTVSRSRKLCTEFREKYPDGLPRNRLFDSRCVLKQNHFSTVTGYGPLEIQHLTKSHQVFDELGMAIATQFPEIIVNRRLEALYPGSGAHLSPLLTAMRLMDLGLIAEARFFYTDLNHHITEDIHAAARAVSAALPGVFDDVWRNGPDVIVVYRAHPIVITGITTRGGRGSRPDLRNYFTLSEFWKSSLIIFHDSYFGTAEDHDRLLRQLLTFQRTNDNRPRILISEDSFTRHIPPVPNKEGLVIHGPYGCSADGEIAANGRLSARVTPLHTPNDGNYIDANSPCP